MNTEEFFNAGKIVELSFFNFRNAITAAYFADSDLKVLKVNNNFRSFFPVLGNVTNAYFPDVLEQLGVAGKQIDDFRQNIETNGFVMIPEIHIRVDDEDKVYSLLSTRTKDAHFSYLNGVQGQFVDRTAEWSLRQEREDLLEQKLRDREVIEEKSRKLEELATRLARYLSPQIYKSIFSEEGGRQQGHARKNLTIFLSDIVQFTDLSDSLEPERLAAVINSYLSEMSSVALECGGTIDKFIGDAILVFFGDPDSDGEAEDALKCIEMALRMRLRTQELQKHWQKQGVSKGLHVRMGVATGYCTVGNFGSDQRLDYTAVGSPVNLASRLQSMAEADSILIDEATHGLVETQVACKEATSVNVKGFVRPVSVYEVEDFRAPEHHKTRRRLSRTGERVEVNVIDSSDIRAAIEELKQIQEEFEAQFESE